MAVFVVLWVPVGTHFYCLAFTDSGSADYAEGRLMTQVLPVASSRLAGFALRKGKKSNPQMTQKGRLMTQMLPG